MFVSKIKTQYIKPPKTRYCQGDILRDLHIYHAMNTEKGLSENEQPLSTEYLPYCVVLSQDCDLRSDELERKRAVNQDKYLKTILLCPAYQLDLFCAGTHIEGWQMQSGGRLTKYVKRNDHFPRYHYLEGNSELEIPDLVLDFKHFFTIPRDMAYERRKDIYLATVNELYRELLSQRFATFLSRIGTPD